MLLFILIMALVAIVGVMMLNEAARVMLPAVTRISATPEPAPVLASDH